MKTLLSHNNQLSIARWLYQVRTSGRKQFHSQEIYKLFVSQQFLKEIIQQIKNEMQGNLFGKNTP